MVCRMTGVRTAQIAAQFAFVPCETYSIANYSNYTRGNHFREHEDPDKAPRKDGGDKADKAALHDRLVQNVLQAWLTDREAGSRQLCFMENPVGFLSKRPFVERFSSLLGLTRELVHYCAYNHPFKKPTHIWTSSTWTPKGGAEGDGLCHGECGHGQWTNSKYKHFKGLAQEPIRGPRGPGATRLKNAVPGALCEEWIQHVKTHSHGNCIIDLCAGFQSLKPFAMKHGFNYIAVDVLGDRTSRGKSERERGDAK